MPQFSTYPAATSIADDDTFLMWDESEGVVVQPTVTQMAQKFAVYGAIVVPTIDALRGLSVVGLEDGQAVNLGGYYAPGDGGGGVFFYSPASARADNGGTIIAPDSGGGRWIRDYATSINVRWFGAVGDNATDDSGAIQAAIDYAQDEIDLVSVGKFQIYLPGGNYFITQSLTIRRSHIAFVGDQNRVTAIRRSFTGGYTLSIKPATTGGDNSAFGCHVRNLYFYADTEMVSGGHLELEDAWETAYTDLSFVNGFGGVSITGGSELRFDRIQVVTGQFGSASLKSGSYGIRLLKSTHTYPNCSQIFINAANVQGLAFPWLERALLIRSADGVWLSNSHFGGANYNAHLNGLTDQLISGVFFSQCYFDGYFSSGVSSFGCLVDDDGSYSVGELGNYQFTGCTFAGNNNAGNTGRGLVLNSASARLIAITGCTFGGSGLEGIQILLGGGISISGGAFRGNNVGAGANVASIKVGNAVAGVTITGVEFNDTAVAQGVRVESTASSVNVKGCVFVGMATPTLDGSTATNNRYDGNVSDASTAVASATSITVLDIAEYVDVTGTTNINTLTSKQWQGRMLRLQFAGILTLNDNAGNIRLVSNFVTAANSILVLMCNGSGDWFEVSRSSP